MSASRTTLVMALVSASTCVCSTTSWAEPTRLSLRKASGRDIPRSTVIVRRLDRDHWLPRGRAVLLGLGLGLNGRRPAETLSGQVAAGLRFSRVELQLSLSFPSLALLGQLRLNLLPGRSFWIVPFLSAGAAISYNNGTDHGTAASVVWGGGLRVGPFRSFRPSLWNRLYASVEVLVSYVFSQPTPPGRSEVEELAVPVLASVGVELWP